MTVLPQKACTVQTVSDGHIYLMVRHTTVWKLKWMQVIITTWAAHGRRACRMRASNTAPSRSILSKTWMSRRESTGFVSQVIWWIAVLTNLIEVDDTQYNDDVNLIVDLSQKSLQQRLEGLLDHAPTSCDLLPSAQTFGSPYNCWQAEAVLATSLGLKSTWAHGKLKSGQISTTINFQRACLFDSSTVSSCILRHLIMRFYLQRFQCCC